MDSKKQENITKMFQVVLRVSKEDSAFVYFTLESNEGFCMYSTLESSLGGPYRDLNLMGTLDFEPNVIHLIHQLTKKFPVEILEHKIFIDGPHGIS